MAKPGSRSGVQSFDGEGQQPHHSVLGRPSVVHNYFLDHIDNGDGNHHHHGAGLNDILVHKHDGTFDHYHLATHYDHHHLVGYHNFGPAHHDHDGSTSDDNDTGYDHHASHDYDNSWADDIDNITAGNPYNHTPN